MKMQDDGEVLTGIDRLTENNV